MDGKKSGGFIKAIKISVYILIISCILGFLIGYFSEIYLVKLNAEQIGGVMIGVSVPTIFGVWMGTSKPIMSSTNPVINFFTTMFKIILTPALLSAWFGAGLALEFNKYLQSNALGGIEVYWILLSLTLTGLAALIIILPLAHRAQIKNKIIKNFINNYPHGEKFNSDQKKMLKKILNNHYKSWKKTNADAYSYLDIAWKAEKGVMK